MVRVNWSRAAIIQIEEIRLYIAQFDPDAAHRLVRDLLAAGDSLSTFPLRGRPASSGTRELVPLRNYILRYDIDGRGVTILQVRHAARNIL